MNLFTTILKKRPDNDCDLFHQVSLRTVDHCVSLLQFQRYDDQLSILDVRWLSPQYLNWLLSGVQFREIYLVLDISEGRVWVDFEHLRIEKNRITDFIIDLLCDLALYWDFCSFTCIATLRILWWINRQTSISDSPDVKNLVWMKVGFHVINLLQYRK